MTEPHSGHPVDENTELIARLRNESGVGTASVNDRVALMDAAATALAKSERDLAKARERIGTILRVNTAALYAAEREIAVQAATIAALDVALQRYAPNDAPGLQADLRAILTRTGTTEQEGK